MWLQVFRGYKNAQLDSVPENDQLVRPLSQLYVTPQPCLINTHTPPTLV